jgi:hypothetical protein
LIGGQPLRRPLLLRKAESQSAKVEPVFLELAHDLGKHAPVGAPQVIHDGALWEASRRGLPVARREVASV